MRGKLQYFISAALLFFVAGPLNTESEEGISLTVTNLRSNKGHVLVSLFKEGQGYPDNPEKAFKVARLAIFDKKAGTAFTNLPAGNYAIAVLHDENDDERLNKNGLGLPKEGYGFSNNVMGAFGPPSYNRAKFMHKASASTAIMIKTRY